MQVQPYLFFEGRCEEAIAFYRAAVGAEVLMLMRYREAPATESQVIPAENADKVMHAALKIGESEVLVSDGRCSGTPAFAGAALSLTVDSEAAAARTFESLGDGGQVVMPLGQTFFAAQFGMVTDRFGVTWMVLFVA